MLYRILADAVLILHAAFIAFVVVGLVLIWVGYFRGWTWTRAWWFRVAHLLAIGYVVAQTFMGVMCPLTDLEDALRLRAGQDPYGDAGFIAYWLHKVIFFTAPKWVFKLCYSTFALAVAGTMVFAPPEFPWRKTRTAEAGRPV
jgi:hypothetical protein